LYIKTWSQVEIRFGCFLAYTGGVYQGQGTHYPGNIMFLLKTSLHLVLTSNMRVLIQFVILFLIGA
jgi:hypothetical protein